MAEQEQNRPPMGRRMGGGPMGMAAPVEKAKDFSNTVKKLMAYIMPHRATVAVVLFCAVLSTAFSIVGPKLLGKATTKLFEGLIAYLAGTGLLTDFGYIGRIIALLIGLYLISFVCSFMQGYLMSKVSMDVTYRLRKSISEKMNRIPLNYYDARPRGEVLSRITNDVDTVAMTLNQTITQIITSSMTVAGVFCMMLSISWLMTVAALLVIPVSLGIMMAVLRNSRVFFTAQQKSLGAINGIIEESYSAHNIVQAFNGEEEAKERFAAVNDELYTSAWKSQFLTSVLQPVMQFVGNFGYVMVCVLGGYLATKGQVEIGDIQAFIQYMRNFTQPIAQLASVSNTLQSTVAAAERVFEFLEETEETPENNEALPAELAGNVTFENVRFGYSPEKTIIHNLTAQVASGQRVAIVGPTGAGKTTIVKLLMRFYDISGGRILIDGADIYRFTRADLRNQFGMVLQDTWLYNATIMENIRYGSFDASDEDVVNAAKAAHCDEFIRTLPGGYQMVLNEESSNISQGQKQMFTIARVILANPKILILDEATSSVDTRTEILIQSAMNNLMRGRTSFVIAHRLSTIKNVDLIFVMKDGDVIEQGKHEELLAAQGFYAELYNSQFSKGVIEEDE
jgi:ATP-binding cassette subfamily B protein